MKHWLWKYESDQRLRLVCIFEGINYDKKQNWKFEWKNFTLLNQDSFIVSDNFEARRYFM